MSRKPWEIAPEYNEDRFDDDESSGPGYDDYPAGTLLGKEQPEEFEP